MELITKEVVEVIKSVTDKKGYSDEEILGADDFQNGFLDSLELVQLVISLEEHFSITIDEEYLDLSKFSNIDSIVELIEDIRSGSQKK